MIYALVNQATPESVRAQIATAVATSDHTTLERFTDDETVEHIRGVGGPLYCIWCLDEVIRSNARAPNGHQAQAPWHFQHAANGACFDVPAIIAGEPFVNPRGQGCYVCLGCEMVPGRDRRSCRCISDGTTYCHLARTLNPPCT